MEQRLQIFLCYAHDDREKVIKLYEKLSKAGFDPWMDTFDLAGGEIWQSKIEKVIRNSHFFLSCLSKNSLNKRGFVQREITIALDVLTELLPEDIYIIPLKLEECDVPERLSKYQWLDYWENDGWDRLIKSIYKGMERLEIIAPIRLRWNALSNLKEHQVEKKIREIGFTDLRKNRFSKGLQHQYEVLERYGEKLIIDHATKLIWQQTGSNYQMDFNNAIKYVEELNSQYFAQHNQWRLPTLEEAMSLMEYKPKNDNLYIDPLFNKIQCWIWTGDMESTENAWTVDFDYGFCGFYPITNRNFVRAVLK